MRRQACYTESIERREVKRALFGEYGENHGDPVHFWPDQSSASEQIENKLQEALDSWKAEKRVVTTNQPFKRSHKIEMVTLKKQ
jgi:hypothetical protein